jgi:hypothetical protein
VAQGTTQKEDYWPYARQWPSPEDIERWEHEQKLEKRRVRLANERFDRLIRQCKEEHQNSMRRLEGSADEGRLDWRDLPNIRSFRSLRQTLQERERLVEESLAKQYSGNY